MRLIKQSEHDIATTAMMITEHMTRCEPDSAFAKLISEYAEGATSLREELCCMAYSIVTALSVLDENDHDSFIMGYLNITGCDAAVVSFLCEKAAINGHLSVGPFTILEYVGNVIGVDLLSKYPHEGLDDFTVISVTSDTGQICSDHVKALDESEAFALVAKVRDVEFIAAMEGKLFEGKGVQFAGTATVDSETINDQSDVFTLDEGIEDLYINEDFEIDPYWLGHTESQTDVQAMAVYLKMGGRKQASEGLVS